MLNKIINQGYAWWYISLIPALKKQSQVDLHEFDLRFEASLVYISTSRTARTTYQKDPNSKTLKTKQMNNAK